MSTQLSTDAAQSVPSEGSEEVTPTPELILTQIAFGAMLTQALYVVAKLGVADRLAAGPRPVAELAAETGTHERSLYRVLRSLASNGIFRETAPKVFALTPLAEPQAHPLFEIVEGGIEDWEVLAAGRG